MTTLYKEIAELIRAKAPDAGFIDIDKGQVDFPQAFDTLIPCALIQVPDTDWDEHAYGNQIGIGTLTVKYLLHLSGRTHISDPGISMSVEALEYADKIHEAVRSHPNVIRRTRSRRYPAPQLAPNVYVVEQHYIVKEIYERALKTTPKRDPQISATITVPIHNSN